MLQSGGGRGHLVEVVLLEDGLDDEKQRLYLGVLIDQIAHELDARAREVRLALGLVRHVHGLAGDDAAGEDGHARGPDVVRVARERVCRLERGVQARQHVAAARVARLQAGRVGSERSMALPPIAAVSSGRAITQSGTVGSG